MPFQSAWYTSPYEPIQNPKDIFLTFTNKQAKKHRHTTKLCPNYISINKKALKGMKRLGEATHRNPHMLRINRFK